MADRSERSEARGWFQWGSLKGKSAEELNLADLKNQAANMLDPQGRLTDRQRSSEGYQEAVKGTVQNWINILNKSHPDIAQRLNRELRDN